MEKFLNSAKSRFLRPGPINMLRPAFPFTKGGASANADTSNQRLILWPDARLPLPMRFGRFVHPHPARSPATPTLNGEPDCNVRMPDVCHPPRIAATTGFELFRI